MGNFAHHANRTLGNLMAASTEVRARANALSKVRGEIGDTTVSSSEEAAAVQELLERRLRQKLDFQLKEGDIVLSNFEDLDGRMGNSSLCRAMGGGKLPKGPVFDKKASKCIRESGDFLNT